MKYDIQNQQRNETNLTALLSCRVILNFVFNFFFDDV
jgi:hypothetical protein